MAQTLGLERCLLPFHDMVLAHMGGPSGHRELIASGRVFLGDFEVLRDIACFASSALQHHAEALAVCPDDGSRLCHLAGWLRREVLGRLLREVLVSFHGVPADQAVSLQLEWLGSNTSFMDGLLRVEALFSSKRKRQIDVPHSDLVAGPRSQGVQPLQSRDGNFTWSNSVGLTETLADSRTPSLHSVSGKALAPRRIVRVKRTLSAAESAIQSSSPQDTVACKVLSASTSQTPITGSSRQQPESSRSTKRRRPEPTPSIRGGGGDDTSEAARLSKLLDEQGWALQLADSSAVHLLNGMLHVRNPKLLGKGRDICPYGRKYTKLKLAFAWKILSPERRKAFELQRDAMARDRSRAEKQGVSVLKVISMLSDVGRGLPETLQDDEGWFVHGTKPEHVLPIMSGGLNERMCEGLFGKGVYLAEHPAKADQYATPDSEYCSEGLQDLHRRLYRAGTGTRHPGEDLFYMFVVRAALGIAVRTKDGKIDLDRPSKHIFASSDCRELVEVPAVDPPLRFHSLVVERGGKVTRFREFVHFHSARFNLEYLVAYRRE